MMNLKMRHFNLRDYQETISTEAAKMLEWLKICYLSMEVRTGKTLTALVAAEKFAASNVLFVTKKKAMPSVRADADLVSLKVDVINYEMVHKYTGDPDLVILDEAHCLGQYPIPAERTKQLTCRAPQHRSATVKYIISYGCRHSRHSKSMRTSISGQSSS
jgi:superfamily II DNA or RNA helicase